MKANQKHAIERVYRKKEESPRIQFQKTGPMSTRLLSLHDFADLIRMKYGKTLKIFVMGHERRAFKSVELVNWTGQAFLGRREHLSAARKRAELSEPAVYLLLSDGKEDGGATEIYVGETDSFADRISSHAQNKDWWTQFIVFVSKDKNLTKAHVKYLELEIYRLAQKAIGTLMVKNEVEPSGARLPESDVAAMNEFLSNMIFVLESLSLSYLPSRIDGQDLDTSSSKKDALKSQKNENSVSLNETEFYITLPRDLSPNSTVALRSYMVLRDSMYVLKAGSFVRKESRSSFEGGAYYQLWKKIIESDQVSSIENEGILKTNRDIEFSSPSAAGAIVRAGSTNGRADWKRVSDDKSLSECELEAVD